MKRSERVLAHDSDFGWRSLTNLRARAGRVAYVLALIAMASGVPLAAEPYIPASDSQVLERLPAPGDARARELRRLREAVARDPENLAGAVRLARRYLDLGRSEADPRYQGYAQAALRPWWDQPQPPPEVLVLRAALRQSRHDFDGALADLSRVLEIQPGNAQAWLTRSVILQVRGNPTAALRSCLPLRVLASELVASACIGGAASLNGQAEQGYRLISEALADAPPAGDAERLWALTTLAEIAVRLGRDRAAERHFRQALALGLRDAYLLGAYADFLLDRNRPGEVQALLQDDVRTDPLLLRLALAEQRLGSPQLAEHVASLRARFAAEQLRGESLHLGNEARFMLDLSAQPAEALRLARANWALQREPVDARVLLEAALEAGDPGAARGVLEWLARTGLEDVRIRRLVAQLGRARP